MDKAIGAIAALATLTILIVGPAYIAITSADAEHLSRCDAPAGCERMEGGFDS